jgi:hypothetical protein
LGGKAKRQLKRKPRAENRINISARWMPIKKLPANQVQAVP